MQQRCQGGEHRNVNIGSGAHTPGRAGRPIEHPGRNLQPSPGCPTTEAATENLSVRLLNHLVNIDQASGPRMPRIKKLVLRDPVGVPSSCCTTRSVRIYPWRRIRRSRAASDGGAGGGRQAGGGGRASYRGRKGTAAPSRRPQEAGQTGGAPSDQPDPKSQRNFTDPESRTMKSKDGFFQAYNAQAAGDADAP